MHCNGKCQLMKKLKQEENKDKQNPDRRSDNKDEVLSSKSFFTTLPFTEFVFQTVYPTITATKTVKMPRAFFHPPGCNV